MFTHKIRMAICLCVASLAMTTQAQADQGIVWRAASEYPATAMPGVGLSIFAEQVQAQTNGQVSLQVNHDDPLSAIAALDAARDGRIDVGDVYAGALGAREAIFNLVSLPFVATSVAHSRCLQEVTHAAYARRFDELGVHLLYSSPWPATGLWSATPVAQLDDLRRLHVRTYDDTSAAFLASLGVDAASLPMGRAMPLVANGTYTGVMSSGDGGAGRRLWQYLRHFTALNYAAPLSFVVVNKSAYAQLAPELRVQIDAAALVTQTRLWEVMRDRESNNRQTMRENGVDIQETLAPALARALQNAAEPVIAAWMARTGEEGQRLLERYRASACAPTR